MTDWKLLAKARGFDLPDADLDRVAPVLASLEASFEPLLAALPHQTEPAIILSEGAILGE